MDRRVSFAQFMFVPLNVPHERRVRHDSLDSASPPSLRGVGTAECSRAPLITLMRRPCSHAGGRGAPRRPSRPSRGVGSGGHRKRGAQQAQRRARALPLHRVGVHPQKMQLAIAHAHRQQDDLVGQARRGHLSVAL